MRRNDWRASLSLLIVGFISCGLMGCGASAIRPTTPVAKAATTETADESDAPAAVELDESPLRGEDKKKAVQALELHDAKKYAEAARLLEELRERHPKHSFILHELALTYRMMGQHDKAVDVLMPYSGGLPPNTLSSLGSALDDAGRPKEAFNVLLWGIAKHPDSGLLYSDLGVVLLRHGDAAQGMRSFHEGMRAEPSWPSNYMNSAKVNAGVQELALALMEGEMFRVLEPGSPRSEDMAILMGKVYRQAVTIQKDKKTGRMLAITSFTKHSEMMPDGSLTLELSFESGFSEPLAFAHQKGLSLKTLHEARVAFVEQWLDPAEKASEQIRKTPLFRLHRALLDGGHFEAYNYWLLAPAFPQEAETWIKGHVPQMEAFARFMAKFPLFKGQPPKGKSA